MAYDIYVCYDYETYELYNGYIGMLVNKLGGKGLLVDEGDVNYNNKNVYLFINKMQNIKLKNVYFVNLNPATVIKQNYVLNNIVSNKEIRYIDYSIENMKVLGDRLDFLYLPYQYDEQNVIMWNRFSTEDKYDVCIIGKLTERKKVIYNKLIERGIKVLNLKDKDVMICGAKVILDIHDDEEDKVYKSNIYDSYVFAGMVVVSEMSLHYKDLDIASLVTFETYENLVMRVVDIVESFGIFKSQYDKMAKEWLPAIRAERQGCVDNIKNVIDMNVCCKLEDNTLEIFSANWNVNGGKESFVKLGENKIVLQRGYSLFGIRKGELGILASFDGFFDDWAEGIQTYMYREYKEKKYDYLILITHDDATNKTTPKVLHNYLVFLDCKELKNLGFRGSYVLVYDLKNRKNIYESCDNKFPIHEWFEVMDKGELVNLGMPVYIIVYNLLYFTKNMVEQLRKYTRNIHIIDNKSTYPALLEYYDREYEFFLERMDINYGYTVWKKELFWTFPQVFAITDPDLEFNIGLPLNFMGMFKDLGVKYSKGKVGFALDLSDSELFFQDNNYADCLSIEQWEKQFWVMKVHDDKYELYDAKIDTTFCVVNKEFLKDLDGLRVGGKFVCKHLPWYDGWHKKLSNGEWEFYKKNNISSGTLKFIERMEWKNNNHMGAFYKDIDSLANHMVKVMKEIEKPCNNKYVDNIMKTIDNMNVCIELLTNYKIAIGKCIDESKK